MRRHSLKLFLWRDLPPDRFVIVGWIGVPEKIPPGTFHSCGTLWCPWRTSPGLMPELQPWMLVPNASVGACDDVFKKVVVVDCVVCLLLITHSFISSKFPKTKVYNDDKFKRRLLVEQVSTSWVNRKSQEIHFCHCEFVDCKSSFVSRYRHWSIQSAYCVST